MPIGSTVLPEDTAMDTEPVIFPTWEDFPENIQVIRGFPKPHEDLFELAEQVPYWWQLARSAPTLAFLVARCWFFDALPRGESVQRVRQYVLMKRSAICAALGFPSDQRTLRLLLKFRLNAEVAMPFVINDLMVLKLLLRYEPSALELLEQAEQIGTNEICLLSTGLGFGGISSKTEISRGLFLDTLPQCEWFFRLPASKRHWLAQRFITTDETTKYVEVVRLLLGTVKPFTRFQNERKAIAYLERYLGHASAIQRVRLSLDPRRLGWPEPPIVPVRGIVPILSFEDLRKEGSEMQHCAALYWDNILLGKFYVYRIERDCRCTIGIRFNNGSWRISEVKGRNNQAIEDPEIMEILNNWIESSPASKVRSAPRLDYLNAIAKTCGIPMRNFRDEQGM